jgi:hypothetical protein
MRIHTRLHPEHDDLFRCSNCKDYFPKADFYKNRDDKWGIARECKSCCQTRQKIWKKNHTPPKRTRVYFKAPKSEFKLRNTKKGFIKYFAQNQYLFKEIFRIPFSIENAYIEFRKTLDMYFEPTEYRSNNFSKCITHRPSL